MSYQRDHWRIRLGMVISLVMQNKDTRESIETLHRDINVEMVEYATSLCCPRSKTLGSQLTISSIVGKTLQIDLSQGLARLSDSGLVAADCSMILCLSCLARFHGRPKNRQ